MNKRKQNEYVGTQLRWKVFKVIDIYLLLLKISTQLKERCFVINAFSITIGVYHYCVTRQLCLIISDNVWRSSNLLELVYSHR